MGQLTALYFDVVVLQLGQGDGWATGYPCKTIVVSVLLCTCSEKREMNRDSDSSKWGRTSICGCHFVLGGLWTLLHIFLQKNLEASEVDDSHKDS